MADGLWIDPDVEDALLREAELRRRRFDAARNSVTAGQGARAGQFLSQWPNASPGLVQAALQGGATDEQFNAVAGAAAALEDGGSATVSPFDRAVGAVTGVVTGSLDAVWQQVLMPLVRGVTTVADTAAQELVQRPLTAALTAEGSLLTNPQAYRQAYRAYGDSAGRNLLQGDYDRADPEGALGRGLFSGGATQARSDQERTLTVDGQQANFGRAVVSAVTGDLLDPGGTAYNVTAGVTQFAADVLLDPSALVTGGASSALRAARTLDGAQAANLLQVAGGVSTSRRSSVLAEEASTFFRNPELLGKLADADAYTIYQSFRKSSANRIDRKLIGRLGDATEEGEVAEVLLEAVAKGHITQGGFYAGPTGFRRTIRDTKFAGLSPRGRVSADDLDTAAGKLDSLLRQANMDDRLLNDAGEVIGGRALHFNRIARLEDGDAAGLFAVVTDALADVARRLPDGSVDDELGDAARRLTRIFDGDREAFARYGLDELSQPIATPFVKRRLVQTLDGEQVETLLPTPQITSELMDASFELPDVQAIRRAATQVKLLRSVYQSRGWDVTESALRTVTDKVFKPLAILRPAYITRIGAEEQARLAAANLDSLFTHPLRFIAANMRDRKALGDLLGDDLLKRAEALNVVGRHSVGILDNPTTSRTHLWGTLTKDDSAEFVTAWRHELGQLAAAPEARKLAELRGNLDGFLDWARNSGDGRDTVAAIARVNDDAAELLTSDRALREWGESIVKRLDVKTGRDGDLLDAIASGRVIPGDEDLAEAGVNRLLRGKLDVAPASVKVERASDAATTYRDQAVEFLHTWITRKPTEYLARYPAYRQLMVRNVGELMGNLADDTLRRDAFKAAVDNLKLTRVEHTRLAQATQAAAGKRGAIGTLDDLNELVVMRSGDQVKDLLFDVTKRSAAQDTFDVVVPFLDAFVEVTKTWAGLVTSNPAWFIRAQAGYRSLERGGIIVPNDFGENVFHYPGGGALSAFMRRMNESGGQLTDAPGAAIGAIADAVTGNTPDESLTLEGRVEGLNLVMQGVGPGFGPVVQWAAGAFVPDTPEYDRLREWISPYGSEAETPSDLTDPQTYINSVTPAWARKAVNAWTGGNVDEVQWNSTVGDVMKVLAESGGYNPGDPEDGRRLIEDAERSGAWVLFVRSLTQAVGPTGPSATWSLQAELNEEALPAGWDPEVDPDGTWHTIATLANERYRLVEHFDGDYQLADAAFLEMFGREPYYLAQGKTRSLRELPVTEAGDTWMRQHEGFATRNPLAAGYFAPVDELSTMDYSVYRRQLEAGDRQSLTPTQQLALANQTKARAVKYSVAEQVAGLPKAQRDVALSQVNATLEELYPGWQNPVLGVEQGADQQARLDALVQAVTDPDAADAPLTAPLASYLRIREQMLQVARSRGVKTLNNQASADLRTRLEQAGMEIARTHPAFRGVWTRVLAREVQT